MKDIVLGIDFGTSNSSAVAKLDTGLRVVKLEGESSMPTHIDISFDGTHKHHKTGRQALETYRARKTYITRNSAHFIPSIKEGLPERDYEGNKLVYEPVGGAPKPTFFETNELASFVLEDIKASAQEQTQRPVRKAVIGRPVHFSNNEADDRRAVTRLTEAANMVDIKPTFVMEPIAAARSFGEKKPSQKKQTTLVFDLGGATLDMCVLASEGDEVEVVAQHGMPVGGTDIDRSIFRHKVLPEIGGDVRFDGDKRLPNVLLDTLPEWHLLDPFATPDYLRQLSHIKRSNPNNPKAVERLHAILEHKQMPRVLTAIERAKINLSTCETTEIDIQGDDLDLRVPISRSELSKTVRPILAQMQEGVTECLKRANVKPQKVDQVLRVGGGARSLDVIGMLRGIFNPESIQDHTSPTAVAEGLALFSDEEDNTGDTIKRWSVRRSNS